MKRNLRVWAFFSLSLLSAMELDTFNVYKNGSDAQKYVLYTYVDGVKEGALAMFLMNDDNARHICVPPSALLGGGIDAYAVIEEQSHVSNVKDIETLFVDGLKRKYPCR